MLSAADRRFYAENGYLKVANAVSPEQLAVIAEEIPLFREGGIGVYASWVHLDVRQSGKARWRS